MILLHKKLILILVVAAIILILILVANKIKSNSDSKSNSNSGVKKDYKWSASDTFSSCSKQCGGGISHLIASCTDTNGLKVDDKYCDENSKPISLKNCNTQPCETYSWIREFTPCNQTTNMKEEKMICSKNDGTIVSDDNCSSPKPILSSVMIPCDETYNWDVGFTPCDPMGMRRKRSVCSKNDGTIVSNDNCSPPEPILSSAMIPCENYSWGV